VRDQNPIRTARRSNNRLQRELCGLAVSPCVFCIEDHHSAGRNHDPRLTDPICEKHHRLLHEQMLREGISLQKQPRVEMRVAMALRSMAVYDRNRADAMDRLADLLMRKSKGN
jgi:hypothetical protein